MLFEMGTPSTTKSGWLELMFKEDSPRMVTRVDPPTPEEEFVICTPATLPLKELITLVSLASVNCEPSTVCTE